MTAAGKPERHLVVISLALVYLLFGSGYLGTRLVLEDVGPVQAMAQRFLIAGLILLPIAMARGSWRSLRVSRREVAALVVTGTLLLGFGNSLAALAQVAGLASGVVALVIAMIPVWAVLLRVAVGDIPGWFTVGGVVLGVAGLVVLVLLGRGVDGVVTATGVVMATGAGLTWAVGSFVQGHLAMPSNIFVTAMYQSFVASAVAMSVSLLAGERVSVDYSPRGWLGLAFLVLISVVGFSAFAWLIENAPISVVATHAYVNPVVAVFLGWSLLAEPVGPPVVFGGGLVLLAVGMILTGERRGSRARDEDPAIAGTGL